MANVIDLFSGAGGTGLGFQQAGFTILAALERDNSAATTYENNLDIEPWVGDIGDITPVDFRQQTGLAPGVLDVLVGCPPCQGFTRMRNAAGAGDERNALVARYLEFVLEFRPRFVLFENVPGIIRTTHGQVYYRQLVEGLRAAGYAVRREEVNAADYGVPQHRRRVIVLGGRNQEAPPFPERTHGNPDGSQVFLGARHPWRTVRMAIEGYPELVAGEIHPTIPNHRARRLGLRVATFIAAVPEDGGSRTDVPWALWLECHRRQDGHHDVYGRLRWDTPANVITSGCTNVSKGRFVHPVQNRGLTPREAAALQGFPDDFVFYGNIESISAQIGNAVPPPLAAALPASLNERLMLPAP